MTEKRGGLAKQTVSGVMWTSLSTGSLVLAETIAILVMARLLSPDQFGLYAATLLIIRVSSIFSGLGVGSAIVQRPAIEERHLRVGFTLSVLLSTAVAALIWVGAPAFAKALQLAELTPVVRTASVAIVFQGIALVGLAIAHRELRFRWIAGLEASTFLLGFGITGPVLAWFGFGVWALVGAYLTHHFFRMVILLVGQPHPRRPMFERGAAKDLLYYGGGSTLGRIFSYIGGQVHKLVVGRWLGADALGFYSLASQITMTPAVLAGQVFSRVLFPAMARLQEHPGRLAQAFRTGVAACSLIVLPTGALLAVVAPELVRVLLGERWGDIVLPLQILALGAAFRTSSAIGDSVIQAAGAIYARAWRQAAFAVATALGAWIGQRWGLAGAAIGVVAAAAGEFLLMAQLSLRITGLRWSALLATLLPGLALASMIAISVWNFAEWMRDLQFAPFARLVSALAVGAAEAILLCWLLPALFLGRDGQAALAKLMSMAPARLRQQRAH